MRVVVAVAAAAPRSVSADAASWKPILVLESHVGDRPPKLAKLMSTLDDLLETRGFAAKPATILRLAGPGAPRPGQLDPELTPARIAQDLNDAFAKFGDGRCDEAIDTSKKAIDEVRRNPALVVNDISNLELMFNTQVALAVCYQRHGNRQAATDAMIDVIRVFSSRPVARQAAWGKQGEELWIQTTKDVQPRGRGRLTIAAGNPDAQIFVEGQMRGMGNASLADLVPGDYHAYVRVGKTIGRQYEAHVTANDETYLDVQAARDSTVVASDAWVGLQFASESARRDEGKFAYDLARKWTSRSSVVVLATSSENGRPTLDGILYRDGVEIRRARIFTDVADPGSPDKLSVFLADGTPSGELLVLRNDENTSARAESSTPRWWLRTSTYVLGAGLLAVTASGIVYAVSPADDHTQPTYTDRRTPAVEGFTAGAVVLDAGLYLWLRDTTPVTRLTAAILSTGAASLVEGAMLVATNEGLPPESGPQRPTYRYTTMVGLVTGGAGVALTGVGIWLYARERHARVAPVVSIGSEHGFAGLAGSF